MAATTTRSFSISGRQTRSRVECLGKTFEATKRAAIVI
jgi:hypothetical protein